jgi:RHS repeat-associated protein
MRVLTATGNTLYYLHSDHLGSTSLTTDSGGNVTARQNYYPYGQIRPGGSGTMPTDIGFTGQRAHDSSLGSLMFFQARYYSALGRFLSADTIVPEPGNPQAFNRYTYVYNCPLNYTDPTGHDRDCGVMDRSCDRLRNEYRNSDSRRQFSFKQFIRGKEAYEYYTSPSNADDAFQDGWLSQFEDRSNWSADTDSWLWADNYAEYHLHEWFEPLSFHFLAGKMQEARARGDVETVIMIAVAFGIEEWLSDRFGGGASPTQLHHFATNKSRTYTPAMAGIASRYGLDLDADWNKELMPQLGRHPNQYHQFVLEGMQRAAREAGDDRERFLELFEAYVKRPVRANPALLTSDGWK